ncbi:MAG: HDOD domain-containing protein [Planctomycetes bacterium]|nr:HDOD domain-containing protein [Planctomycetota bacterium]
MKPDKSRLQQFLDDAHALPTVPAVAMAVLRMAQNPRVSIDKMAKAMEKDPALAAKTLRFANSSYYGLDKPIINLSQALVRIGIRATTVLALSFSLVEAGKRAAHRNFDFPAFWQRSLVTSVAARRIAQYSIRDQADNVFVGALLADIGCPFLCQAHPDRYLAVINRHRMTSDDLAVIESRTFGICHADISGLLLNRWHMPATLVSAVAAHHDLNSLEPDKPEFDMAVVIMAASLMADILIRGAIEQRVATLADLFRKYFLFKPSHVNTIVTSVQPEVLSVAKMLEIDVPPLDGLEAQAKAEMLRVAMNAATRAPAATEVAAG